MGPIAVRRLLRAQRRRALWAGLIAVLAAAVIVHHAEPSMAEGAHHDTGAMAAMQLCLGAMVAVGAAVVAVALGSVALGRWRPVLLVPDTSAPRVGDVPTAIPRAGPLLLTFLCVSRR